MVEFRSAVCCGGFISPLFNAEAVSIDDIIACQRFRELNLKSVGHRTNSQHLESCFSVELDLLQTVLLFFLTPTANHTYSAKVQRAVGPPSHAVYSGFKAL